MSTGPGPTRKDDGSHDASVDEIAELLVEEDSQKRAVTGEHHADDGLDVMLETPGPVLATTFLPPPPAPVGFGGEEAEGLEDPGASSNLAYEDLLAKLVLPAKAPEPQPTMPEPVALVPEAALEPIPAAVLDPVLPSVGMSSSPSFQVAPPSEERTLVTDNPLVLEEQQAAAREGRASTTLEQPRLVQQELAPAVTEPVAPLINAAAKSKLLYLMLGALLMLGAMVFAAILIKLVMPAPAPAPQVPVVVAPPAVPQPQPSPPAQVQPLPPTPAPAPSVAVPPPTRPAPEAARAAEATPEEPAASPEQERPRAHKREGHAKPSHPAAPKPAPAAKAAPLPPAPAAKPTKAAKKGKTSGYSDPFDN